jgi:hypothetical protein
VRVQARGSIIFDSMTNHTQTYRESQQEAFLIALADTGVIGAAAQFAGVDRSTVYRWRERDPKFELLCQIAVDDAADKLESEAIRRAVEGWDEPVFYSGLEVGVIRKRSDMLLSLLLKANKPEKYRERIDQTTTATNKTQIQIVSEFPADPKDDVSDLL